ncbi:hypothetical protein JCM8097_007242 [Rhodosporidiobolus ruineniae]
MRPSCSLCTRLLARSPTPTPTRSFATLPSSLSLSASSAPSSLPLRPLRLRPTPPASLPRPLLTTRTYATPAARQPQKQALRCTAEPPPNPSDDFEPVEDELKAGEVLDMGLTEAAVKQIHRAQTLASDPSLALRLAVESGGCHGYQYKMQVTSQREADDYLFRAPPPNDEAKLLIDAASLPLVKGSTIDYATELIGSSFRVVGNPQSKDAGCGCGVSWELKDLD